MGPRGNKVASSLVKDSDLILAIGTRLGFNSTFYSYDNISKSAKIVQVDIDPIAIGRYFPVEIGVNIDVKIFLENLTKDDGIFGDPIDPYSPYVSESKILRDYQQQIIELKSKKEYEKLLNVSDQVLVFVNDSFIFKTFLKYLFS